MASIKPLDEVLDLAVASGRVAGVVAMVAAADRVLYRHAAGQREICRPGVMSIDTVFWVASMTKVITTVAALQLVERGLLQLDSPLVPLVPALREAAVLEGFDSQGQPRLRAPKRPITLRHLLAHTAGFGYDMWSEALRRYADRVEMPPLTACRRELLRAPLLFDPGDRWQYGINHEWVGQAVEAAAGRPLDEVLEQDVFVPLDMRSTGFELRPPLRARLAAMHCRAADGGLQTLPLELPYPPEVFLGGAGLYSTAPDFVTFMQVLLNDGCHRGRPFLRSRTVRSMLSNQIGAHEIPAMRSTAPALTTDLEFFPDAAPKWGFGVMINTQDVPGGRRAGSAGWAGLGNTYFWIDARSGIAAVILMQLLPFGDRLALQVCRDFEQSLYAALAALK